MGAQMNIPASVLTLALLAAGCAQAPSAPPSASAGTGIEIKGLHLSAHGYILDLRYRVHDRGRAAALLDPKQKVYLVDEARRAQLGVAESPVIGGMRQTARNRVVYTDRDYFILFVNPGRAVRAGDRVQLAVGGHKVAELTVR
jgi:hypothetical protein